jgi:hypothetical protein
MLEYMTDPKHRSEFEETELECDQKNGKGALCCNKKSVVAMMTTRDRSNRANVMLHSAECDPSRA